MDYISALARSQQLRIDPNDFNFFEHSHDRGMLLPGYWLRIGSLAYGYAILIGLAHKRGRAIHVPESCRAIFSAPKSCRTNAIAEAE
jgi:hypothetical protein